MAVNRLMSDIMKISELMGFNFNLLDMSTFGIEPFVDSKGENKVPLEVVYDKVKDPEYLDVSMRIEKIYNAFMYGEHAAFWKEIILNRFESQTQIDFMLLVSFIYMRQNNDNKEARIADATVSIASVLAKYI